jgi:hypothetical protein
MALLALALPRSGRQDVGSTADQRVKPLAQKDVPMAAWVVLQRAPRFEPVLQVESRLENASRSVEAGFVAFSICIDKSASPDLATARGVMEAQIVGGLGYQSSLCQGDPSDVDRARARECDLAVGAHPQHAAAPTTRAQGSKVSCAAGRVRPGKTDMEVVSRMRSDERVQGGTHPRDDAIPRACFILPK